MVLGASLGVELMNKCDLALVLLKWLFGSLAFHPVVIHYRVNVLFLSTPTWLRPLAILLPCPWWPFQLEQMALDHSYIVLNLWYVVDKQRLRPVILYVLQLLFYFLDSFAKKVVYIVIRRSWICCWVWGLKVCFCNHLTSWKRVCVCPWCFECFDGWSF